MSLMIDVDKVSAILIRDDGWHLVNDNSLLFDAYEFVWWGDAPDYLRPAQVDQPKDCTTGFSFRDECGIRHYGRIDAILAVRTSAE